MDVTSVFFLCRGEILILTTEKNFLERNVSESGVAFSPPYERVPGRIFTLTRVGDRTSQDIRVTLQLLAFSVESGLFILIMMMIIILFSRRVI